MPKDYVRCREAMLREGHSMKESQRICAINYAKKHDRGLPRDSKSGLLADQIPVDAAEHPIDSEDYFTVLDWLYETLKAEGKLENIDSDLINFMRVK